MEQIVSKRAITDFNPEIIDFKAAMTDHQAAMIDFREEIIQETIKQEILKREIIEISRATMIDFSQETINFNRADDSSPREKL